MFSFPNSVWLGKLDLLGFKNLAGLESIVMRDLGLAVPPVF
jgi:hypothetical protein